MESEMSFLYGQVIDLKAEITQFEKSAGKLADEFLAVVKKRSTQAQSHDAG